MLSKELLERYDHKDLELMVRELLEQVRHTNNSDSKFSVASIMIIKTGDGELVKYTGCNTEMSGRAGANVCGERNSLHEAIAEFGRDFIILDIIVTGVDKTKPAASQEGRRTPCCHLCLEEIFQFMSPHKTVPTLISQVPFCLPTDKSIRNAIESIVTDPIERLIPPIMRYSVEEFNRELVSGKARGIFRAKTEDNMRATIEREFFKLIGKKMSLPPLNGDITHVIQAMNIDMENISSPEQLTKMNGLLSIARNIQALRNFDEQQGSIHPDIRHIESAICVTTDDRYFIGSSLAGKNISRQESALHQALSLAKSEDHKHKVTDLFLMGDPTASNKKRLYPLIGDLYDLSKRSCKGNGKSGGDGNGTPQYGMKLHLFAPNVPKTEMHPDCRKISAKLTSDTSSNIVTSYNLSDLVRESSMFVTAKASRDGHAH